MIGLAASVGIIILFAGIHLLANKSVPVLSSAAMGLETIINYGKAA